MIYFDMDGVLAKYDYAAYSGEIPAYIDLSKHYFFECEPDGVALKLFNALHEKYPNYIKILTSVSEDHKIRDHQVADKLRWCHKYIDNFDEHSFMIAVSDKRNLIMSLEKRKLTSSDILIDDYKVNLDRWQEGGGTAIKYINGINSPDSWSGIKLYNNDFIHDLTTLLVLADNTLN